MILGKLQEDIPEGNLPKILPLILFQLQLVPICLSIWHWRNCRRMYQEGTSCNIVINEFHISLSVCWHRKMSAIHQSMSSIYLSIYLTLGKLWEDVPGKNLLKISSTLTPSLLMGKCQQLSIWHWKNVSIYSIYLSIWYWGNRGRSYQEGTSQQQHWFYFISLFINHDIGKIVGEHTWREPPKDIVIDSISTIHLSIWHWGNHGRMYQEGTICHQRVS